MRVGIITLPLENNYGGILQNYALQKVLRDMGHQPMTCRWIGYTNLGFLKSAFFSLLRGGRRFPITPWVYNRNREGLENFIRQNIDFRFYRNPSKFLQWFKPHAMIVGSDQVWRPMYNAHLYSAYLDFVPDKSIKKISYAASFGVGEWEYSEEQTVQCKDLLSRFDSISVREDSGVVLCKEKLDADAKCVLDPTLLLDSEVYKGLCLSEPIQEECILVYMVDYSASIKAAAEKLSKQTGLPIRIMEADKGVTASDSVAKWLAAFRDTKYVITDSFHGCVFSIIFNKPFWAIGNKKRGMSRFDSLLGKFVLHDRLVVPSDIERLDVKYSVNWEIVNEKREILKDEALSFINKALNTL